MLNSAARAWQTIRDEIVALMREEKALYDKLLRNAMLSASAASRAKTRPTRKFISTLRFEHSFQTRICRRRRMRELFRTFEAKSRLVKILNECVDGKPSVGSVE